MSTLGDAADVNPVIKFLPHSATYVAGNWSVSPFVDMLPFGMTIPATVPQRLEFPEGLMICPLYINTHIICIIVILQNS